MSLTKQTESQLLREAQNGDPEAMERLIEALKPLAVRISGDFWAKYRWVWVDREDLFQVARLALWQAIQRYDPARGARLSTYATDCMIGQLRQARADYLGLSERARRVYGEVWEAYTAASAKTGRTPTASEVTAECGVSAPLVQEVLRCVGLSAELVEGPPAVGAAPQDALDGTDLWWAIANLFGQPVGAKWIALLLLHERIFDGASKWAGIAAALAECSAEVARFWPDLCARYDVPSEVVSSHWPAICALFPPPTLNEGTVKQWYNRRLNVLYENRDRLISA